MSKAKQSRRTQQQKRFVRDSLRRALSELHEARVLQKGLPNARNLFVSNDNWFSDSDNIESVRRGISEMENENVKSYSIKEIQELLGV